MTQDPPRPVSPLRPKTKGKQLSTNNRVRAQAAGNIDLGVIGTPPFQVAVRDKILDHEFLICKGVNNNNIMLIRLANHLELSCVSWIPTSNTPWSSMPPPGLETSLVAWGPFSPSLTTKDFFWPWPMPPGYNLMKRNNFLHICLKWEPWSGTPGIFKISSGDKGTSCCQRAMPCWKH